MKRLLKDQADKLSYLEDFTNFVSPLFRRYRIPKSIVILFLVGVVAYYVDKFSNTIN